MQTSLQMNIFMYFDMALCQKRDFSCDSSEKGDGIAKSSLHG
jgi:hypothetical protein